MPTYQGGHRLLIKMIEKKPFRKYHELKKVDSFTVRLNAQERMMLEQCKTILEQSKDSTALKQLAFIGADVLHEQKITRLLALLFKNKRNNERLGIAEFD